MNVTQHVNAESEPVTQLRSESASFDFEATFYAEYPRIARVIGRVVGDPGRAEELAVEVFWRLLGKPGAQGPQVGGWLYRTAVRIALDELRRKRRQARYEGAADLGSSSPTPEQLYSDLQKRDRVQTVLARLGDREAGLLLGLGDGWTYQEMADALDLNPASIGTFLRRAKDAFRKEYVKRYGREPQREQGLG